MAFRRKRRSLRRRSRVRRKSVRRRRGSAGRVRGLRVGFRMQPCFVENRLCQPGLLRLVVVSVCRAELISSGYGFTA